MKHVLTFLCFFTIAAAIWLIVMESVLKHHGYAGRSVIDACIVVQSAATLLSVVFTGRSAFRITVMVGAVAMALLGTSAILTTLRADHFEGFVIIIGLALIAQCGLTVESLRPSRHGVQSV